MTLLPVYQHCTSIHKLIRSTGHNQPDKEFLASLVMIVKDLITVHSYSVIKVYSYLVISYKSSLVCKVRSVTSLSSFR